MITSPQNIDLRKKVMRYIEEKGKSQNEASKVFNIHRNTLNRWCRRYKKEGNFAARIRLEEVLS